MNKETWAGAKAGAITGLLFNPFMILVLTVATGGTASIGKVAQTISQMPAVTRLGLSVQDVMLFALVGLGILSIVFGALGLLLGIVFVKTVRKLTIKSVYINALIFGCLLFVLFCLIFRFNIWLLFVTLVDSVVFAYLFNRWTKTAFDAQTESNPVSAYCDQCGAKITEGNKFCTKCGKPL